MILPTRNPSLSILVISLANDRERRDHMRASLDKQGLSARFIDAVDGSVLRKTDIKTYHPLGALLASGRFLNPGELGCYQSHLHALTCAEESDLCLIIEDDVRFEDRIGTFLDQLCHSSWRAFDVLRLGAHSNRLATSAGDAPPIAGVRLLRPVERIIGTQAYIVTGQSAPLVRATLARRIVRTVDCELIRVWSHKLRIYKTEPLLVFHEKTMASRLQSEKPVLSEPERKVRFLRSTLRIAWQFNRNIEELRRIAFSRPSRRAAISHPVEK